MAHPYNEHRDHHVQHKRVGHIAGEHGEMFKGGVPRIHRMVHKSAVSRATGGRVDAERDAVAVTGMPARQRLDRPMRARGGRTKHKGTNVNVIVAPHPGGAAPMPVPAGNPPNPPPAVLPRPPMASPSPVAGAVPMPPGGAPGMPIRKTGGRAYAKGGAVKSGPAWAEGLRAGTQVQHTNNKSDGHNVGRGPVITRAHGGGVEAAAHAKPTYKGGNPTEHPTHGHMGPKLAGGSKGGLGRLAKAHRAARA